MEVITTSLQSFFLSLEHLWAKYIISNFSEFAIITFGTFIVHEFFFLLFNGFYFILDENKLFVKYKIHPDRFVKDELRWKALSDLLKGHVFQLLPITVLAYPIYRFFGFYASSSFPTFNTFAVQFIIFNILEDTGFYWIHYYMHTPYLFTKVHYLHHEYITPFSLTGSIAHPVEFLFNFLLPIMIGPFLMGYLQGVHIITFWLWIIFREMRSTDAHSGYNLPFHPLRIIGFIYGGPQMHDFHHQVYGRNSNFGGYKFWDWLMGTDKKFHEFQNREEQKKST